MSLESLVGKWRDEGDSTGVIALKALDYCQSNMQAPPEWVIDGIVDCWRHYSEGTPVTAWESERFTTKEGKRKEVVFNNVPATLGEAFGVADHKLNTAKRDAKARWFGPMIVDFLELHELPVCEESFRLAGEDMEISGSLASKWYYLYRDQCCDVTVRKYGPKLREFFDSSGLPPNKEAFGLAGEALSISSSLASACYYLYEKFYPQKS